MNQPSNCPLRQPQLRPATAALHYGQAIFEGMKAYKNDAGEVLMFRPLDNWARFNKSATRMCMPESAEEIFMGGLTERCNSQQHRRHCASLGSTVRRA